jgi:tRNA A37 threonylcarbamoyladenosine biosynthesis protein TsaE
MFVYHSSESGAGKTTFVHSLAVFLPDRVERVVRPPTPNDI